MKIFDNWCENEYIQNRTNWCWAVACRMVGEQFIRNNPVYNFTFFYDKETVAEGVVRLDDSNSLRLAELEGIRTDIVRQNGVLYPDGVCHSFVLLDWTAEDKILLYDPWDGHFGFHAAADVFCNGISVPLGTGIIKWAQYVL